MVSHYAESLTFDDALKIYKDVNVDAQLAGIQSYIVYNVRLAVHNREVFTPPLLHDML